MKHLPKHLQPRWRYLAVGIESWPSASLGRRDFQRAVWTAARDLVGDAGSATLDLTVLRFEASDGDAEAVVRTYRGESDRARAVLACIDAIDGTEVGIELRGTSGTVRACEEKYIRGGPIATDQSDVVFENAERAAVVRGDRVDVRCAEAFAGATKLDLK